MVTRRALLRLHISLEDVEDLRIDLNDGFAQLRATRWPITVNTKKTDW
ncbi:hypothetical protein [Desulfovibrio cuneatus]|nr:hypothetical protein [Desulfovibrio cuneatus]